MNITALKTIDPASDPDWNDRLLSTRNSSFFHSANWARALSEAYDYIPRYLSLARNGKPAAVIPFMEIDSFLTGKRGVSLPFTDFCDPLMNEDLTVTDVLDDVLAYGNEQGWKYIELRMTSPLPSRIPVSSKFKGHILDLSGTEQELQQKLRDSTRRNIKKAEKEGVSVTLHTSYDAMMEFCRLNSMTRREHGLPPQPRGFFEKVHHHVLAQGMGFIALAKRQEKCIAGAVYFQFGRHAIYKYGASDRAFQQTRANNLVMWEAIRWCWAKGLATLDLGRTDLENTGLLQFKGGWGCRQHRIYYYKYDLKQQSFVSKPLKLKGIHNRIFRMMPAPLLEAAGNLLYRHMG